MKTKIPNEFVKRRYSTLNGYYRCKYLLISLMFSIPCTCSGFVFLYPNIHVLHTISLRVSGDPATRAITVSHLDFSPKPLRIPGNVTTAYDIKIHRRIGKDSHLRLNVTMDKKLLGRWHSVPCSRQVGTW